MSLLIALDAGHGLNTAGKRTPSGIREWSLNSPVVEAMASEFKKYKGASVVRLDDPSGEKDISLTDRTNKANRENVDLVISVHHNAYRGVMGDHGGTETWVQDRPSEAVAGVIQQAVLDTLGLRNRGVKFGNLHMNRESNAKSVLVEVGFMDSNTDKAILEASNSRRVGVAIAQAVAKHYGLKKEEQSVPAPKPVPQKPSNSKIVPEPNSYFELGMNVYERDNPTTSNNAGLKIRLKGSKLNYNAYLIDGGYVWLRLETGKWIPWRKHQGEKYGVLKDRVEAKPAPAKPAPTKPAPAKPASKKYITLKGRVPLYDDNSEPYGAPNTVTREVEVIRETADWYLVSHSKFRPNQVWVKKSDLIQYANMSGQTWLFVNKNGDNTYPVPSVNKTTGLISRSAVILEEGNGRVKVDIPKFSPSTVWVANSQITKTATPVYPIR